MTASTGMDALAQVIEPFVSKRANPMVDLFCREGIQRAARSLLQAYQNGMDQVAREDMAFTSLMGGLRWQMQVLGLCMALPVPWAGCFGSRTGQFVPAFYLPWSK